MIKQPNPFDKVIIIFINLEGEKKFTRLYRVSFEKLLLKVVQQKLKYIFSYPPAFSFRIRYQTLNFAPNSLQ